jgi:hypothetical protein
MSKTIPIIKNIIPKGMGKIENGFSSVKWELVLPIMNMAKLIPKASKPKIINTTLFTILINLDTKLFLIQWMNYIIG